MCVPPEPGTPKYSAGSMNVVEYMLYPECESPQTRQHNPAFAGLPLTAVSPSLMRKALSPHALPWTSGGPISTLHPRPTQTIWTRAPYFPPLPPAPPLGSRVGGAQRLQGTRAPPNCHRSLLLGVQYEKTAAITMGVGRGQGRETKAGQKALLSSGFPALPHQPSHRKQASPVHIRGMGLRERSEVPPSLGPQDACEVGFPFGPSRPRLLERPGQAELGAGVGLSPMTRSYQPPGTHPSLGRRGAEGLPERRDPAWPCPLSTPWQLGKEKRVMPQVALTVAAPGPKRQVGQSVSPKACTGPSVPWHLLMPNC